MSENAVNDNEHSVVINSVFNIDVIISVSPFCSVVLPLFTDVSEKKSPSADTDGAVRQYVVC